MSTEPRLSEPERSSMEYRAGWELGLQAAIANAIAAGDNDLAKRLSELRERTA